MKAYKKEYQRWLDSPALSDTQWQELNAIADNDDEIESRFYAPLQFGTAGLRGVMGMGTNRMNVHMIRHTTQAFANVILRKGEKAAEAGIVICYDCRINSCEFAQEAACVMSGNGIKVRLFEAMRPTPELSFAIRYYGAAAGINITASHNPKEYNGYKVYWSDGAQLPPRQAEEIADEMEKTDVFSGIVKADYEQSVASGMIELIGSETDEAFLKCVLGQAIDRNVVSSVADRLKIVYTPFHGAGHILVPEALKRLGITQVIPVPEQMVIDGTFPTVASPNPENPEGFRLAVELAERVDSDLIIGTDPDSDRVGVMVRGKDGEYRPITGNQMGVLLLDYIIGARQRTGTMPDRPAAIKTIVTTGMARTVAEKNGVFMADTFTGFKFMAEKIAEFEEQESYRYLLAYEESYGYMMGDYVRDKDAVTASMMIAEMAAYYMNRGMTLADAMEELYEKYGYFGEQTVNIVMPGIDGAEKMAGMMKNLRTDPPAEIAGVGVVKIRDYLSGVISIRGLGSVEPTEIKGSNVIYFELEDGSTFILRPSGTEPKLKIYILVKGADRAECDAKAETLVKFAESLS